MINTHNSNLFSFLSFKLRAVLGVHNSFPISCPAWLLFYLIAIESSSVATSDVEFSCLGVATIRFGSVMARAWNVSSGFSFRLRRFLWANVCLHCCMIQLRVTVPVAQERFLWFWFCFRFQKPGYDGSGFRFQFGSSKILRHFVVLKSSRRLTDILLECITHTRIIWQQQCNSLTKWDPPS